VTPDAKGNWINLTDNEFDNFLPLVDKRVKAGKSNRAVFQLFSRGVATQRDEWIYDFSKSGLIEKMQYLVEVYQEKLTQGTVRELDIKCDRELTNYANRQIDKYFAASQMVTGSYRPYVKKYLYFDQHFNGMTYQLPSIFPAQGDNLAICCTDAGSQKPFMTIACQTIIRKNPPKTPRLGKNFIPTASPTIKNK